MYRAALLVFLSALPTPALACLPPLPPPPGVPYPTETERLRRNFDFFDTIVLAEVAEAGEMNGPLKMRIVYVFKGSAVAGQVIEMLPGSGFDPPICVPPIVYPPAPVEAGGRGVIAFRASDPRRNGVAQHHLELMIREGWIEPPPDGLRVN